MAYRRVGTSYRNLAGSTGGVTDELGSALLSTDTSGSRAQTLGPQLSQQITFGIPNSDFSLLPQDPDYPITADNELPFFTYLEGPDIGPGEPPVPEHLAAYVREAVDYPTPSGYVLELTAEAGAGMAEKIAFERWIQLPSNYAETVDRRPKIHVYCPAPGASAEDVQFFWSFDYYDVTQTNILDSRSRAIDLSNLADVNELGIIGAEIGILPEGAAEYNAPSGAYWLRVRFGIEVQELTTTTEQLFVTGLRIDDASRLDEIRLIDGFPTPTGDSFGYLEVYNSTLTLAVNTGTRPEYDLANVTAGITFRGAPGYRSEPTDNPVASINGAPTGARYYTEPLDVEDNVWTILPFEDRQRGAPLVTPTVNEDGPAGEIWNLGPGEWLLVLRARVAQATTGTPATDGFCQIRLMRYGVDGLPAGTAEFLRIQDDAMELVDPRGFGTTMVLHVPEGELWAIYAEARHDDDGTIEFTIAELTLLRLGNAW